MNENTPETKNSVPRPLTIVGLIGLIILISWLAVQLVNVLPNVINSLASLSDSVYNYDPKKEEVFTLTTDNEVINSGETINVSWNKLRESDTFTFSYECQDGIAVDIITEEKEFSGTTCDSIYDLGSTETVALLIESEKTHSSDLIYNIEIFHKNSTTPANSDSQSITIINPNIKDLVEDKIIDTDNSIITEDTDGTEVSDTEQEIVETPNVVPSAQPEYIQEYIYEIPASNPNGTTDLVLSNLHVGAIGFANFIETPNIINSIDNGIRFTVHNIGTRTSEEWTYVATLPGDIKYKSKEQEPLKPNERATITIEFPQVLNDDELQTFSVTIISDRETNYANNEIEKTAIVVE